MATRLISAHFAWSEMLQTAHHDPDILRQQQNPPAEIRMNIERFCHDLLDPVRSLTGRLRISSGYRCPALNEEVDGSKTSAHMAGMAADCHPLDCSLLDAYGRIALAELWALDQCILEYGTWIHVGGTPPDHRPRHEFLMIWESGKYLPFNPADPRVKSLMEAA